ncbi:hypothetical protein B0H19DRAFT_1204214 [Mycena capillaripes]|nr:hypothetical protein B0H19DRAFT_1204214 [Mycena capillaripes]
MALPVSTGTTSATTLLAPHPSDLQTHLHHPAGDLRSHSPQDLRQPEFSSAFGLMGLDDPNVLAGLANDGMPFFSTAAQGRMGFRRKRGRGRTRTPQG